MTSYSPSSALTASRSRNALRTALSFLVARERPPDDQHPFLRPVVRREPVLGAPPLDGAELPCAVGRQPEPPRKRQLRVRILRQLGIRLALERRRVGPRFRRVLHAKADQVVERLDEIDRPHLALLAGGLLHDQPVGERIAERFDVQERSAARRLHLKHVLEEVVGDPRERRALRAVHLQVVERILVAFEPQVLEAVRDAPRWRGRLAVLPVGRIDHLLDARLQDGVEMVAHLDQNVLALPAVLAVQVDHGMRRRARPGKVVEDG